MTLNARHLKYRSKPTISFTFAFLAFLGSSLTAASAEENIPNIQAIPAENFLDRIGINTHFDHNESGNLYADTSEISTEIKYLGFNYARDNFASHAIMHRLRKVNAATGIKYDVIFKDSQYEEQMERLKKNSDIVVETEGLNEIDNWPPSFGPYNGYRAAIELQKSLYQDVRNDDSLAHIRVNNLTIAYANNLRHVGNISDYADKANVHIYLQTGGYYGAFVYPSLNWSLDTYGVTASERPRIVTETGWWTLPAKAGVPETVQAKFLLDMVFDAFLQHVSRTYIYELNDEAPDPTGSTIEKHFGLFRADGTPKPAATAFHNLHALLQNESSPSFQPHPLSYKVEGLPNDSGHQVLLQKANGSYIIVLWNETMFWDNEGHHEVSTDTVPVKLMLGKTAKLIRVFDPTISTESSVWLSNTNNTTINVTDHPLLVFVNM